MKVYILEWGESSNLSTSLGLVKRVVFPTLEDACAKASQFPGNYPAIIEYDLTSRAQTRVWDDIPALDRHIASDV